MRRVEFALKTVALAVVVAFGGSVHALTKVDEDGPVQASGDEESYAALSKGELKDFSLNHKDEDAVLIKVAKTTLGGESYCGHAVYKFLYKFPDSQSPDEDIHPIEFSGKKNVFIVTSPKALGDQDRIEAFRVQTMGQELPVKVGSDDEENYFMRASEILCPWDNRSPPNGCIQ